MTGQGGVNRLGQGIEAMQASARAAPATGRPRSFARIIWWFVFLVGVAYFILPLIGTLAFSLREIPFGAAYTAILSDQQFFSTLGYSFVVGIQIGRAHV